LAADRKSIVCLGADPEGKFRLLSLPLNGSASSILYEDASRDVTGVALDHLDRRPLNVSLGGAVNELVWLDAVAQKRSQGLEKSFPGMAVNMLPPSDDGLHQLVEISAPDKPSVYLVADYAAHKAEVCGLGTLPHGNRSSKNWTNFSSKNSRGDLQAFCR
jgi:hypothetical protein